MDASHQSDDFAVGRGTPSSPPPTAALYSLGLDSARSFQIRFPVCVQVASPPQYHSARGRETLGARGRAGVPGVCLVRLPVPVSMTRLLHREIARILRIPRIIRADERHLKIGTRIEPTSNHDERIRRQVRRKKASTNGGGGTDSELSGMTWPLRPVPNSNPVGNLHPPAT